MLADTVGGGMTSLDPIAQRRHSDDPVPIPEPAVVDLRAGTGMVLDSAGGALWAMDAAALGTQPVSDEVEPLAAAEGDALADAVVDTSGRIHRYRAGTDLVQTYPAGATVGAG